MFYRFTTFFLWYSYVLKTNNSTVDFLSRAILIGHTPIMMFWGLLFVDIMGWACTKKHHWRTFQDKLWAADYPILHWLNSYLRYHLLYGSRYVVSSLIYLPWFHVFFVNISGMLLDAIRPHLSSCFLINWITIILRNPPNIAWDWNTLCFVS